MKEIEPFVIELTEHVAKHNGEYDELSTICEWLEWWILHLPHQELPSGTRIVTTVHLPEQKLEAA